jgi:transposase-like protein
MAGSKASNRRGTRRRRPLAEKRRLVELTLRDGASIRSVAREHGVNRNSLYQWLALYRAGKLNTSGSQRAGAGMPNATFLPVTVVPTRREPPRAGDQASSIVQVTLASGAALRIETDRLDVMLIGALIAELQKSG